LSAIDPEDDAFTIKFQGCATPLGTIELCANTLCESFVTLDCSMPFNAAGVAINVAAGEKVNGQTAPIQGYFTSGPVATFAEGQEYNTIHLLFSDSVSAFAATQARVIFDVKILNIAPQLFVKDEDVETSDAQPALGEIYNLAVSVFDQDFVDSDFYVMTVEGSLDAGTTQGAEFDVAHFVTSGCPEAVVTATMFKFTCTYAPVQEFMRSIAVLPPLNAGEVVVKISANDNGFVGQCNVPYVTNAPCPLTDNVAVTITYQAVAENSNVTTISASAAAGVAGAAAIAAVALFRKFNNRAKDSYQPWDAQEDDDATAVNPLYVGSGMNGDSLIYEAKTDL